MLKIQIIKLLTQHKALALNSKTKTYILLAAVLGIWGSIAYKIISGINTDISITNNDNKLVNFSPKIITKVDTFTVQQVDRDPFLGTLTKKKEIKKDTRKAILKKEELPLPQIVFRGMIKEQQSSNQIFVVDINGNQYLLKKGQEINGIKLLKGNASSITISFDNRTHTISAQ